MKKMIRKFIKDEKGAELLEYAIVILIVAGIIIVMFALGDMVKGFVENVMNSLQSLFSPTSGGSGGIV